LSRPRGLRRVRQKGRTRRRGGELSVILGP
jgi:hypothetical protein